MGWPTLIRSLKSHYRFRLQLIFLVGLVALNEGRYLLKLQYHPGHAHVMALTELIHLKDDPLQYYASTPTTLLSILLPYRSTICASIYALQNLFEPHCKDAGMTFVNVA